MKKHKSVVAILLAVMMIFTMMPMMAFAKDYAAGTVDSWDKADKYATMKDSNNHTFKAAYMFGNDAASDGLWDAASGAWADGLVKAVVSDDTTSSIGDTYYAPADNARFFYDFDGSAFVNASGTAIDSKTFSADGWTALQSGLKIRLVAQNYGSYTNYAANKAKTFDISLTPVSGKDGVYTGKIGNWNIEVTAEGYDAKKADVNQTVKFSVTDVSSADALDGKTAAKAQRVGSMPSATITVSGTPATWDSAEYYLDTVGGAKAATGVYYDGAEHTVVATPVEGWTVSYKVYDKTKGDYVAADSVKVKNVGEDVKFIAVWTKGTTKNETTSMVAKVNKVTAPKFAFDMDQSVNDTLANYLVEGTEYNALDYVVIIADEDKVVKQNADAETARVLYNAASKAAVAANSSDLMNWLADFYEIEAKEKKSEDYDVQLTLKAKAMTSDARKELEKKYETLMKNFGLQSSATPMLGNPVAAQVFLNADKLDEEVEFTKAPVAKTYKGSKTTKKGKLKKNQSFTVKAVSNKGRTINYKLVNVNTSKITINKTTGKITVKKGLTKGTYTVKVKAYVPGRSTGLNGLYEYQTIKIKIKK